MATAQNSMGRAIAGSDPMLDLNTTPLIDIMLVLLIMFIITIPPQSHKVGVDLPASKPTKEIDATKNLVLLSQTGSIGWNDQPVSDAELRALLAASAAMAHQPETHFRPDAAARYERVDEVMGMVAQSGVTRFGFVGNDRYRDIF